MSGVKRLLAVAVISVLAGGALAQEHEPGEGPCKADREKFCKDVKPGGGRLIQCMKEHHSELSEACKEAIKERREQWHEHHHGGTDAGM